MSTALILLVVVIAALMLMSIVLGLVLKLLGFLLVGLVIGALARLVLPGNQLISLPITALSGGAGGLVGGFVGEQLLHVGFAIELVISVACAAAVIALVSSSSSHDAA